MFILIIQVKRKLSSRYCFSRGKIKSGLNVAYATLRQCVEHAKRYVSEEVSCTNEVYDQFSK